MCDNMAYHLLLHDLQLSMSYRNVRILNTRNASLYRKMFFFRLCESRVISNDWQIEIVWNVIVYRMQVTRLYIYVASTCNTYQNTLVYRTLDNLACFDILFIAISLVNFLRYKNGKRNSRGNITLKPNGCDCELTLTRQLATNNCCMYYLSSCGEVRIY